jgi:erythromycin esterase-like protein
MASPTDAATLVKTAREIAHPLTGTRRDYDLLMEIIGSASFALIGEASHGTHQFYRERAEITKRLITEKQFLAVAVEADWPDAYRVNRYVQGISADADAREALGDFRRFPAWMWRNTDVVDFIEWLRRHNDALPSGSPKIGFYGLDMYSLRTSMEVVLQYLKKVDPAIAARARARYACFDQFDPDIGRVYGFLTGAQMAKPCREEAVHQLIDLQRLAAQASAKGKSGITKADDELFNALQNARLVKNSEEYYRMMFLAEESTWNLRDRHMVDTLDALVLHLKEKGQRPKIAVWAHNSHLGDARATEMASRGELNVGQLVRERHPGDAALIGFMTHHGTVTAASDWDQPAEKKNVRRALPDSYEAMFHEISLDRFLLPCRIRNTVPEGLRDPRLERAIGVIYRPDTERRSHYFLSRLGQQFDVILHFDETRAVEPLEPTPQWHAGELPDTYPFAV